MYRNSAAHHCRVIVFGILSFCLVFSLSCLTMNAAAREWYVRPAGGEYGMENGSSYQDAWDGLLAVVWGEGGVQPGDTLSVCGTHIYRMSNHAHIATQAVVNVPGGTGEQKRITIRGDCPGDPGVVWGGYIRDPEKRHGYSGRFEWTEDPSHHGVWSTVLDAGHYGDWFFEQGDSGCHPLEKASSIDELAQKKGSHYSVNYEKGSMLYVHPSTEGNPKGRILFNLYGYRFSIRSNGYITFRNLGFMNPRPFWMGNECPHHVRFEKCRLFYGTSRMFSIRDGMDYMEVVDCEIAWAGNGIYTISSSNTGAPSYYRFTGNYIHDIGVRPIHRNADSHAIGIQGGTNGLIADNVIENSGSSILLYAFTNQVLRNVVVTRNQVRNCHTLTGTSAYGISTQCSNNSLSDKSGNQFFDNIVTNCPVGYRFQFEHDQEFYHNIAAYCGIGLEASRTFNNKGPRIKARNNIFFSSRINHVRFATGAKNYLFDSDYNLYFPDGANMFVLGQEKFKLKGWQRKSKSDANSFVADPLFRNPLDGDFHLKPGSPAAGAGIPIGITRDMEGLPFPAKPDIGPYSSNASR